MIANNPQVTKILEWDIWYNVRMISTYLILRENVKSSMVRPYGIVGIVRLWVQIDLDLKPPASVASSITLAN